jgi:hypothetical protein
MSASLASVRGMIDNATDLIVLLCADHRACCRNDAGVARGAAIVMGERHVRKFAQ